MVCQELVWIITGNDWIWGRVKQLSNALLFYPGPSHRSSAFRRGGGSEGAACSGAGGTDDRHRISAAPGQQEAHDSSASRHSELL